MAVRHRVLVVLSKVVCQDHETISLYSLMRTLIDDNLELLELEQELLVEFGQEIPLPPSFPVMQVQQFAEHVENVLSGD